MSEQGVYVYCVCDDGKETSLGPIGIENNKVYTISYKDICAVVHDCVAEPYESDDAETVKEWVRTHQKVVDTAQEKLGTALPMTFDVIVQSGGLDPKERVKEWLKKEYEELKKKMEKVKGKQEFGVQVFWEKAIISEDIIQKISEIKKLKEEMETKSKGQAYFYKQKIKDALKKEMEKIAEENFKKFYKQIRKHVDDVKIGKIKRTNNDREMLMNLSCLVEKEKVEALGAELEKIQKTKGFSVKFTGPWPPYSFVTAG